MKKLYVGNLSYEVDSSELEQLFSQHGQVNSAQIINDRDTGRSKGFGFVEMANDDEANAASEALNGQQHGGRALTVNEARPREDERAPGHEAADGELHEDVGFLDLHPVLDGQLVAALRVDVLAEGEVAEGLEDDGAGGSGTAAVPRNAPARR